MFLMLFIFFYFMLNVVITLRMCCTILTPKQPENPPQSWHHSVHVFLCLCSMFTLIKKCMEKWRAVRKSYDPDDQYNGTQWHIHTIIQYNILSSFFLFIQHVFFVFILNSTRQFLLMLSDLPFFSYAFIFSGPQHKKERNIKKPVFRFILHS